jgi:hypothetical protein
MVACQELQHCLMKITHIYIIIYWDVSVELVN